METNKDKIGLAKKVQALAKTGAEGEREAAVNKLNELMEKHGITDAMLSEKEKKERKVEYGGHQWLLARVAMMVLPVDEPIFILKRPNRLKFMATDTEFMEIATSFAILKKSYERQRRIFKEAFISKNELFPKGAKTVTITDPDERQSELFAMAMGIKKTHLTKMIEG